MNRTTWKTTYRFILKNRTFTAINLIGLTAGLTVSFFLLVYIINEYSYNNFHQDAHKIFRIITQTADATTPLSPILVAHTIQDQVPAVSEVGRMVYITFLTGPVQITEQDKIVQEKDFICASPNIGQILTLPVISGNDSTGLKGPRTILLSQSAAKRCFGNQDPLDQELEVEMGGLPLKLKVTGILRDLPWNSTIQIDFLASYDVFDTVMTFFEIDLAGEIASCDDLYAEHYIRINASEGIGEIHQMMPAILDSLNLTKEEMRFSFQPITDIYLESDLIINDPHQKGEKSALVYYGSLALFILLLAGINYSILSTARSSMRFKEMGMRKILGVKIKRLRVQILLESMILTFLSFPLTFLLLGFLDPFLDRLLGYDVALYTTNMLVYLPLFALITLLIGLFSGLYVAFYLSSLNPLKAIQEKIVFRQRFSFTRLFIIIQLFISLSLLISVIIIFKQLSFCLHKENRIDADNLVMVPFAPGEFQAYPLFRDLMIQEPFIRAVSGGDNPPPSASSSNTLINIVGSEDPVELEIYAADAAYFSTLGIPMISGSDFSKPVSDSAEPVIILNQKAVESLQIEDLSTFLFSQRKVGGVVEDFHIHSMYDPIKPAVFNYSPEACSYLIIRHKPGYQTQTIDRLRQVWDSLAPGLTFSYRTYPETLKKLYEEERNFGQIILSFTILAFIITGMGLFGLALLIAERSTKMIAIRKVLGATNKEVLFMMQKEFLIYMAIASALAIPTTWFLMQYWLSEFYYATGMGWYIFAGAIVAVALFVSSIILSRTWSVLHRNPIRALKYE